MVYSSLYPYAAQPQHGIFVEVRLHQILATGGVHAKVVAPVPWFPLASPFFGRYSLFAQAPRHEVLDGVAVARPRFPVIPKIGMNIAPFLMAAATRPLVRRLAHEGIDLIDAQYFYPDGVAAVRLGAELGRPVVVTAHGSDLNVIAEFPIPRRQILDAAARAAAVIAVSNSLKRRMIEIGIDEARITVLPNGVDLDLFAPVDHAAARAALGLTRPAMVAVGNILKAKGQDVAIRALTLLDDMDLIIVGAGPDEAEFKRLATSLGVGDRVRFVGRLPQAQLPAYFNAAEVSVLPSMREGWPCVLAESMACGTPAIATDVGGVAEIITAPEAGRIMTARTPEALAAAVRDLRAAPPAREDVRAFAVRFGWAQIARAQRALYQEVIDDFAGR